ncbi:MAG: chemotaxis protein CheX [Fimbriiglobus sp.]|jgi:CheY-specific phosphatase CheX|nr:chemotaxis protein CheX [Fimbriiglobus sp.]
MPPPDPNADGFPPAFAEAVKAAVENTFKAIAGEKPVPKPDVAHPPTPCVAGIISFIGDSPWSLSWFLPSDTAPALAHKFTGLELTFDSQDMGDVAGELVNVLAGEVVAQLDRRRVKVKMSLPTVARGSPLELMPEKGAGVVRIDYASKFGSFWLQLATPGKGGSALVRLPGA